MKFSLLTLMIFISTTKVFAQGATISSEVLADSTLKFKKEIIVGPKGQPLVDLFFVDGKLCSAHEFILKSRDHSLEKANNLCILTINRASLVSEEGKDQARKLSVGKTVTLGDKKDLGHKSLTAKDHLDNYIGIGNGYDAFGNYSPAFVNVNENFSRYPIQDEKGTITSLYCYAKYSSIMTGNTNHWVSDYKDTTLIGAFGDYMELNLLIDQSNKNIDQGNPNHNEKDKKSDEEKKKEAIVIEG
ncbi:MAG: hypothetical protein ACOYL6_05200 [Bacteriovoracaceae bacterium]